MLAVDGDGRFSITPTPSDDGLRRRLSVGHGEGRAASTADTAAPGDDMAFFWRLVWLRSGNTRHRPPRVLARYWPARSARLMQAPIYAWRFI